MYESYFEFRQRPFAAVPRPEFYFPAEAIEQARQTLTRCIQRGEGPGLVIGPSGSGKSLLCHLLAAELGKKFRVAMLATARLCTRRGLLQNILFELGLPYRQMEEGELRLSLIDHLDPDRCESPPLLLLVDEAHSLPLRLFEEIRMITNLVRHGQPRVRLVLIGDAALEERFAMPRLASFNQRLAARCYLDNLGRDETFSYVRFQIERASGDDEIFTEDALQAVYHASGGVPRLINQVCDHALILACAGGKRVIEAGGIEEAWADLQQLPAPQLEDDDEPGEERQIIEFGELDDLEDSAPASRPAPAAEESAAEFQVVSPEERLDEIEQQLALVDDTAGRESHAPTQEPAAESTGVELQFHTAHDPFSESFAEEEVVIDHYAALEAALVGRQRVTSQEGREIASLLPPSPSVESPMPLDAPEAESWEPMGIEPTSEPVDELEDDAPATPPPSTPEALGEEEIEDEMVYSFPAGDETSVGGQSGSTPPDDRDLIDIEDEPDTGRREDYRHLFSRLRQDD